MTNEAHNRRTQDPTRAPEHMAHMIWGLESHMNQTAADIWPKNNAGFKVPFREEARRQLRWHGILRKYARIMQQGTRAKLGKANYDKGARARTLHQHTKGGGLRLGQGELWSQGDAVDAVFRMWVRYTRWHAQERIIQRITRQETQDWDTVDLF